MKPNMGQIDRLIRTVIAATFILLYVKGIIAGTAGIILIVVAVVFLLTSMVSVCPLYSAFGISTRKKRLDKPQ